MTTDPFPKMEELSSKKFTTTKKIPIPKNKVQKKKKKPSEEHLKISNKPSINIDKNNYEQLLHHLLDKNQKLTAKELLTLSEATMGKGDPLESTKKGLENAISIKAMIPLLNKAFFGNNENEKTEGNEDDSVDLMSILPLLEKSKEMGGKGNIDPTWLMLSTLAKNKGFNNMGLLLYIMQMMQNSSQQQTTTDSNGKTVPVQPQYQFNPEFFTAMVKLITETSNKKDDNTNNQLILGMLKLIGDTKNQQPVNNNGNNELMLGMMKLLIEQQRSPKPEKDDKSFYMEMMKSMQATNDAKLQTLTQQMQHWIEPLYGKPQKDPKQELLESINFYRNIEGDKRALTKDELDFKLKSRELDLEQTKILNQLKTEEKMKLHELQKGDRVYGLVEKAMDSGLPQMIGGFVNEAMSRQQQAKQQQSRGMGITKQDTMSLDPSDYDDL